MVQTYQPPLMEIGQDTIPELQPIFSFLNSHSNKLYQEGYFLKLNDLDSQGRPHADRSWAECFAQLVGTILSLWDAAALDAAGHDGEVAPKFINLADASIKMIETLPTRSQDVQPLQNVLSISTAGKNRYLFHFNSLHSLTQWTAGIRLAMFEHATLQEAYTGSLIAGKGKSLNNIKVIMDRTKVKTEDWARVRFGAGTPWRRCWCVISPPDEKEVQKIQKSLKKKSAYDRPSQSMKGDIKFYDTKKTKKVQPIATIKDAYSAYAIYPQSKPLIDQSTLVKVEGVITIHSTPETTTEGFVFVMPEVHPAVTGFEMMLRWLFPVYDIFGLYGRPTRLIADTLDVRSLMFALPQEKRYGYLEILDVAGLIHESGSQMWKEKEWRTRLKELTSTRMTRLQASGSRQRSRASSYRGNRNSLPSRAGTLRYEDGASIRSTPSLHNEAAPPLPIHRQGSAPIGEGPFQAPGRSQSRHQRSVSEALPFSTPRQQQSQRSPQENQLNYTPSRLSYESTTPNVPESVPPLPPAHGVPVGLAARNPQVQRYAYEPEGGIYDRSSSESERRRALGQNEAQEIRQDLGPAPPPAPVVVPPAFAHEAGAKPQKRPQASPELRRANSRMSISTLSQLVDAGQLGGNGGVAAAGAAAAWSANGQERNQGSEGQGQFKADEGGARNARYSEDQGQRGVIDDTRKSGIFADHSSALEGMALANAGRSGSEYRQSPFPSVRPSQHDQHYSNIYQTQASPPTQGFNSQSNSYSRDLPPLSQTSVHSQAMTSSQPGADSARNFSTNLQQNGSPASFRNSANFGTAFPTSHTEQRPDIHRLSTAHSITRKPLPVKQEPPSDPPSPLSRTSLDSLREHMVDEEALDRIISHDPDRAYTMDSRPGYQDSIYDNDSTVSPDYASTRKSTETKRSKPSMDRPRVGVLKTVGTAEPGKEDFFFGDTRYGDSTMPQIQPAIPSVDFGPTPIYRPGASRRASSSGILVPPTHERSKSTDRLSPSSRAPSPANLHISGNNHTSERPVDSHERSPSRNLTTPDGGRRTPSGGLDNDHRRSVAWQPGTTIGGASPGNRQSITPEQFVQQRAAANRITPVYAHGRNASGQGTPPAVSRHASSEWPSQQHNRQVSFTKDMPPRPQSRGTQIVMNPSGDYSAHLSAREQEHVARVTGSPLINMASNPSRQAPQGGGLIGAIEAREKEKRDMKEGLSGHMVQHAIAQRQQHNQSYQSSQQALPSPSPQLTMPGQYPPSPFVGTPQQQYGWNNPHQQQYGPPQLQRQWTSPAAQQYWTSPATSTLQQQQPIRQNPQVGSLPQHTAYQQQQVAYQQQLAYQKQQQAAYQQQGQFGQGQQQPQNGSYFGNGR